MGKKRATRFAIFLVGAQLSGKTDLAHMITENAPDKTPLFYAHQNAFIHEMAEKDGKRYRDVYEKYRDEAERVFDQRLINAIKDGQNIIVDRMNPTKKSRGKLTDKFNQHAPKDDVNYVFVAINVRTPIDVLEQRFWSLSEDDAKFDISVLKSTINRIREAYEAEKQNRKPEAKLTQDKAEIPWVWTWATPKDGRKQNTEEFAKVYNAFPNPDHPFIKEMEGDETVGTLYDVLLRVLNDLYGPVRGKQFDASELRIPANLSMPAIEYYTKMHMGEDMSWAKEFGHHLARVPA